MGIHLKHTRAASYIAIPTPSTHGEWHSRWFYLCNDNIRPFTAYTGSVIGETKENWKWGVSKDDMAGINKHVAAITHLKEKGLDGAMVVRSYHHWRFAPLMYKVLPDSRVVGGTVMVEELLPEEGEGGAGSQCHRMPRMAASEDAS